jgi:hypothetical protein
MHALRSGLIVACVVGVIAASPVTGGFSLHKGSPHRFAALAALLLFAFVMGALASLATGE